MILKTGGSNTKADVILRKKSGINKRLPQNKNNSGGRSSGRSRKHIERVDHASNAWFVVVNKGFERKH